MEDLSHLAAGSLWPTGQHAGAITGRPDAMSAPGGESHPGLTEAAGAPDPDAEVTEAGDRFRHTERGER